MFENLSFKDGLILCTVGILYIVVGSISQKYLTVRLAGTLIATVGLTLMGIRLYQRIKVKSKR